MKFQFEVQFRMLSRNSNKQVRSQNFSNQEDQKKLQMNKKNEIQAIFEDSTKISLTQVSAEVDQLPIDIKSWVFVLIRYKSI